MSKKTDRLIRLYKAGKLSRAQMARVDSLIGKTPRPTAMPKSNEIDRLMTADKRRIYRSMREPKFDENVSGLPKYHATESLMKGRTPAGITLKEELQHRPQNFRELLFKAPTIALKGLGVPFQKIESAIANPLMELQQVAKPDLVGRLARGVKEGLTSERIGEIGDVPRRAGFGEGPSRFIGFGSAMGTVFPAVSKGLSKVAKVAMGTKALTPLKELVKNSKFIRWRDIEVGKLRSAKFIRDTLKGLSPQERRLIPFLRERSLTTEARKLLRNPKIRTRYKTHLKPVTEKIGKYLDDAHADLTKFMGQEVGFWENYVTHIWDIKDKSKIREVGKYFATKNPTLNKRFIGTLKEGIEKFKLKPKTTDIGEILHIYDNLRHTTTANAKFVNTLIKSGLVKRKAPGGWKTIDHPAFNRFSLKKGKYLDGKILKKGLITGKSPARVHPEIYEEVKALLDKPFDANWIKGLEGVNAFAKRFNLALSLFHPVALFESGVAATGWRRTIGVSAKSVYDMFTKKDPMIFSKWKVAQDGVKHGLQLGVPTDAVAGKFYSMLKTAELRAGNAAARGGIKTFTRLSKTWDKGLWDYFHNNLKIMAYESIKRDVIRGGKYRKMPLSQLKRQVAQWTNNSFGGQPWEALGKSPKWLQSMHWALLSPDWTYSTLKQALAPTGVGAISKQTVGLSKHLANKFWINAAVQFWGGMNVFNYAMTKHHTGKGRFMWDNPPDKKTQLFIGYDTDQRGAKKETYIRWGKQFRELPEFFIDPIKKFGGKLSPAVRETVSQFTKHHVGGYPTKFADKSFMQGLPYRAEHLAKMFAPFSLSGQSLVGALPKSKGMSAYKARELFKQALLKKDMYEIREIWQAALANDVNPYTAFTQARSVLTSDDRNKLRTGVGLTLAKGGKISTKGMSKAEKRLIRQVIRKRRDLKKLQRIYGRQ